MAEPARQGQHTTGDGDLAAILMALGCEPIENKECDNVYSEQNPYRNASKPGDLFYNLHHQSGFKKLVDGQPSTIGADEIKAGYNDKNGIISQELADLIASIPDATIRREIEARLPQVIASFVRCAFKNRRTIAGWWKGAPAKVLLRRGKKTYLVDRESPELAKKWNL